MDQNPVVCDIVSIQNPYHYIKNHKMKDTKFDLATFGGGCFWCTEAVFKEVNGVENIVSGYTGGTVPGKPTYKEVCSGLTGHAEVIQIIFDPTVISYENLVIIFMTTHDPTTLNRQGGDIGTQYRSVIFYHDDAQKIIAEKVIKELSAIYDEPIVTEISPISIFHEAEEYHQNYYANNQTQGYCSFVITPKLSKLRKLHAEKLK
jgi:peptide-methionine (S)-S-oxide reductase